MHNQQRDLPRMLLKTTSRNKAVASVVASGFPFFCFCVCVSPSASGCKRHTTDLVVC